MNWNIFETVNILIVDDDDFNRELIISFLLKIQNINCIEAENGLVALGKLKKHPIDMILLDLHMPTMNGADTLKQIKEDLSYQLIPVIIITSDRKDNKHFKVLNAADNFLFKPIESVDLEYKIYNYMKLRQEKLLFQEELRAQWSMFNKITLLLVDDDPFNREIIMSFLSYNSNITFIEASHGEEALEKLEKYSIDMILLDLHMPVMNGAETLRIIKQNPTYDLIPIIMITADMNETKNFRILSSADDFLFKPVESSKLESKIYNHLQLREENITINEKNYLIKDEKLTAESPEEGDDEKNIDLTLEIYRTPLQKLEFRVFNHLKMRQEYLIQTHIKQKTTD